MLLFTACTKDREFNPISTEGEFDILHVWDFNQNSSPEGLLEPFLSYDFARLNIQTDSTWDDAGGTDLNAFENVTAGRSLRIRNPSYHLDIQFSTKGYGDIRISYATMRTNSGAKSQFISYANDGLNFSDFGLQDVLIEPLEDWQRFEINFETVPAIANKDLVVVRISFADGNISKSGNNRFDNIIIEGRKLSN